CSTRLLLVPTRNVHVVKVKKKSKVQTFSLQSTEKKLSSNTSIIYLE
ncbi:unnamed protein product, partial [Brassica oleracea]